MVGHRKPSAVLIDLACTTRGPSDKNGNGIPDNVGNLPRRLFSIVTAYPVMQRSFRTTVQIHLGSQQSADNKPSLPQFENTLQIPDFQDAIKPGVTPTYYIAGHLPDTVAVPND